MAVLTKLKKTLAVASLSGISCLTASCGEANDNLSSAATAGDAASPFWETPHMEYVAVENKVDDDDLYIWDVPYLEKAFIDTAPADRNDGLIVGELGVDGGDKDMILQLAEEIADGQYSNIDSLLIVHKGKLLFESYYRLGRINMTHPQASATKTYTGLALGRAIQLGYLTMADLNKPVISLLDDLDTEKFVEGAERITLHQALTMRSGIRITEEQREEFEKNPSQIQGQSLVQALLEQSEPITSDKLSSFSYGNYSSNLVMQVIDAVTPGAAKDFIKYELLGKLGITTYGWQTNVSGLPQAGWRSSMTSRSMVKFGALAMNKGQWNGQQLVSEEFIAKATSRILYTGDDDVYGGGDDVSNEGYGYFWWNAELQYGDKSYYAANAQGGGGQFIILIDELDLIVVMTGHEREPKSLQITAEKILPAFVQ